MRKSGWTWWCGAVVCALLGSVSCGGVGELPDESDVRSEASIPQAVPPPYYVYVTNERGGDLSVIAGGVNEVVATIPLGKRPRGIKVSPDGTQLFVALSG